MKRHGKVDFDHASVERKGKASIVSLKNSRYLNAEDDTTLKDVETAVDLAMLDPETMICVLRGSVIEDGKYQGQRVFCTRSEERRVGKECKSRWSTYTSNSIDKRRDR